jgi:ribonucleotide monophosphatase NagD (HAD superfamily)
MIDAISQIPAIFPATIRHRRIKSLRLHADSVKVVIIAGIESGIDTVLVLTGITRESDLDLYPYPYRPHYVLKNISEICS